MNAPTLASLFSQSELKAISGRFGDRNHPTAVMIGDPVVVDQSTTQIAATTDLAVAAVLKADPQWLQRAKPRLLQTKDLTEPSGALAEIRAYGALLGSEFRVEANTAGGTRPSAEFEVFALDNTQVTIEVHAKQLHGNEQALLRKQAHDLNSKMDALEGTANGPHVLVSTTEVYPFGRPDPAKPNDSDRTNAISKLCGRKDREHQAKPGIPFVLWLDFQDAAATLLGAGETAPLSSAAGAILSGVAWYAFYGWRGAPVLHSGDAPFGRQRILTMEHDGRFRQGSNVAAVILSFPEAIALLENPRIDCALNDSCRRLFLTIPAFDLARSLVNWGGKSLESIVEAYQQTIEAAAAVVGVVP